MVRHRYISANEDILFTWLVLVSLQREPPAVEKMTPSCLCGHITTSIWNTATSNDPSSIYLPSEEMAIAAENAELLCSYLVALELVSPSRWVFLWFQKSLLNNRWYVEKLAQGTCAFHLVHSHIQIVIIISYNENNVKMSSLSAVTVVCVKCIQYFRPLFLVST